MSGSRVRALVVAGAMAGMVCRPTVALADPPTYTARVVQPIGAASKAFFNNDAGDVVGEYHTGDDIFSPLDLFLESGGGVIDITPMDHSLFFVSDLSNLGDVLYHSGAPYLWRDGELLDPRTWLDAPPGAFTVTPVVMNDAAQFAGHHRYERGPQEFVHTMAFWQADGSYTDMGVLDPEMAWLTPRVRDMNNLGQAVGAAAVEDPGGGQLGLDHAWLWTGGELRDIHPAGYERSESEAFVISAGGHIGGQLDDLEGGPARKLACRWRPDGTFALLERMNDEPGNYEEVRGINDDGWIVGFSWLGPGAVLWHPDGGHALADLLIDPAGNWPALIYAYDINNEGVIIGYGQHRDSGEDTLRGFELTPCWADFDRSKLVNTADVIAFGNAWAARRADADMDRNGSVDSRDYLRFLVVWAAGCP